MKTKNAQLILAGFIGSLITLILVHQYVIPTGIDIEITYIFLNRLLDIFYIVIPGTIILGIVSLVSHRFEHKT